MFRNRSVGGWAIGVLVLLPVWVQGQDDLRRPRYLGGWAPVAQQVRYQAAGPEVPGQLPMMNNAGNSLMPQQAIQGMPAQLQPSPLNSLPAMQGNPQLQDYSPQIVNTPQPPSFQQSQVPAVNSEILPGQNGQGNPNYAPSRLSDSNPMASSYNDSRYSQPPAVQQPLAPGTNGTAQDNGRLTPRQVATGLPFVTQPPQRTGNYFTSPYSQSAVQFANYQYPAQNPSAAAPTQSPTQSPMVAGPPLPQQLNVYGYQPTAYNCVPGPSFPAGGAVPSSAAPPTLPPNFTPGMYTPDNAGYTPLFSLGQENYNVLLGRGIVGQPTVYVPGQPVRNFLRYISP